MWQTLTLQRPKLRDKQARGKQGAEPSDKSRLRRAKTFCDNERYNDEGKGNQRTWLKNIKNWKKRFLKNDMNYINDNLVMKSQSVSHDSLDKISCGPGMSEKVSRRAILDRSLNYDPKLDDSRHDQEDIWFSSAKLFEDHVSEIHGKWDAIEDDIWGKVIVMERNRRVAKAYVRSPVVSVGGGQEGFDGLRVGLQGFDNPFRDEETRTVLSRLGGQCCRIQMDSEGFVEVTRTGRTEVSVQSALGGRRPASQPGTLPRRRPGPGCGRLAEDQSLLMFDMTKLKRNMADSFMYHGAASRNRRELELECVTTLSFVKQSDNILEQPCWIILINLVSLDFLRTSLAQQPVFTLRGCPAGELRTRPRLSLPHEEVRRLEAGQAREGRERGQAGQESLYYGGVQARISQFVLSEANRSRRVMQDKLRYNKGLETEGSGSESESEYSQIDAVENIYSDKAYDVKWR